MENDLAKKNILQMYGKIPEAMLIISNGIYCDAATDGMFYYKMGLVDELFSSERFDDYIIRRPYPNKRVAQMSIKKGRNVFKTGYPILYDNVSKLDGRKYLAFDVWIGLDVPPKDLSAAPDACHIYVPLDIHATRAKPFVSFWFYFLQAAVLPNEFESTDEFMFPTKFEFEFFMETSNGEEDGYISRTRWKTNEQVMGRPMPSDKMLTLDETLTDKEHGIYVYYPIEVNGQAFNNTDFFYLA